MNFYLYLVLYLLAILFLCVVVFTFLFYEWRSLSYRKKCRELPGPQMNPIFGIGIVAAQLAKEDIVGFVQQLWNDHGDVLFYHTLGRPNVILFDAEHIETLFSNIKYIRKGKEYDLMRPWLGNGLLTSAGDHWHTRRKQLTPSFHFKILENYLPIFTKNANNLITKFLESKGGLIEINSVISSCTLNIICGASTDELIFGWCHCFGRILMKTVDYVLETTMGTSLDLLTEDAKEYANAVKEASEITLVRALTFWLIKDWTFYLSTMGRKYRKMMQKIHSFVDHVIEERKAAMISMYDENPITGNESDFGMYKQRKSFLDHLLSIQRDNPTLLSDDNIREEVNTFMFEGHDTISSAITWTLFMLANYPEIQHKVREELEAVFPNSDCEPTIDDLNKLQYLEMVIKETLRLYPSVPYFTRLISTDLHIGRFLIPAETNVAVMTYLLHRNPKVFEDPDKFDPQRFLPERAKKYHPYGYLPFSAGYRNCIGQRFAMMEGKTVLATILKKFYVTSILKREDIKVCPSVVLRPNVPIKMFFISAPIHTSDT